MGKSNLCMTITIARFLYLNIPNVTLLSVQFLSQMLALAVDLPE